MDRLAKALDDREFSVHSCTIENANTELLRMANLYHNYSSRVKAKKKSRVRKVIDTRKPDLFIENL